MISCSSSATASRSQATARRGTRSRSKVTTDEADTTMYGTTTRRARTRPTPALTRPETTTRLTSATHVAVTPSNVTTLRCNCTRLATIAPSPSRAARLKTLEPRTTPAPMLPCPWADAVIAEVISGESAARATTKPSVASVSCHRLARRSSRETNRALAPSDRTAAAGKTMAAERAENCISLLRRHVSARRASRRLSRAGERLAPKAGLARSRVEAHVNELGCAVQPPCGRSCTSATPEVGKCQSRPVFPAHRPQL